jgi:hypothetical protein
MIDLVDIRSRATTVLQDTEYIRWTKTELNNYIHDAVLDLVRTIRLPVEDSDVVISATNYKVALPSTLMDISGGSLSGRELPVVTTSEMKKLSSEGRLPATTKEGEYSVTQIFGNPLWNYVEDWTTVTGTPQALIIDQRSSGTITVWPIPIEEATLKLTGTSRPPRMSDEVPYQYSDTTSSTFPVIRTIVTTLQGWIMGTSTDLIDDANTELLFDSTQQTITNGTNVFNIVSTDYKTTCDIDPVWVDALTYGTLERAYLKEHDLRNVEKSGYFMNKKMQLIADAHRVEPLNPASITGGINLNRMIVRR